MLQIKNLDFSYAASNFSLSLNELVLEAGKSLAIVGPSGSGKTTLLNLIAGILQPDMGEVHIASHCISTMSDAERRHFRAENIGLVFQSFELLPYLTVADNILLPTRLISRSPNKEIKDRMRYLAETTGVADKLDRFPNKLSQGESQRVAVCRAMLLRPKLILADEPTGNLDQENKQKVVNLLSDQAKQMNSAVIMVTHDRNMIASFDEIMDFSQLGSRKLQESTS